MLFLILFNWNFLNWSIVDIQYCVSFKSTIQWFENEIYEIISTISLPSDGYSTINNHLSPYKIITVLLTVFFVVQITCLWLIYFVWKFIPPNPNLLPLWQNSIWVLNSTYSIVQKVSVMTFFDYNLCCRNF